MSWSTKALLLALLAGPFAIGAADAAAPLTAADPVAAGLLAAARSSKVGYDRLAILCDDVGHRLAGSPSLDAAIALTQSWLKADGQEKVAAEPVLVPVWDRGAESLTWLGPGPARSMGLLGLGGSIGTSGVEAPVVVIHDFAELGPQVKGKIVLYNHPMEPGEPTIQRYGPAVAYRGQGASKAAQHGAVAVLVRSVTTRSLYTPHTGGMRYDPAFPSIPAAAIPTEEADRIDRLSARGVEVRLRLQMGATTRPDVPSANVVGELRGATKPNEVVLLGAHIDSWDVGQGAHDDGAGVAEVVEALRLLRATGKRPARTIRVVLFTNEENGLRGGEGYAKAHASEVHVAAIESDLGGGYPLAFSATGTPEQVAALRKAAAPLAIPIEEGGGGADIGPLKASGALLIGLRPDDSHYFDVHHTPADTFDKIVPADLAEATGALASLAWLLANAE